MSETARKQRGKVQLWLERGDGSFKWKSKFYRICENIIYWNGGAWKTLPYQDFVFNNFSQAQLL
jgi:hypothetical protein